ncbi:hypothetical protein EVAR_92340_1 [Eumeta japonica]|uniref:Uncharacterized protein n=1 Tax=Eumeta variegata TaxID=151549 RepID=A0A4C1TM02_EUMVA|nr:hypothetical protein EVAR_92340_1 [Eumeta japonica]
MVIQQLFLLCTQVVNLRSMRMILQLNNSQEDTSVVFEPEGIRFAAGHGRHLVNLFASDAVAALIILMVNNIRPTWANVEDMLQQRGVEGRDEGRTGPICRALKRISKTTATELISFLSDLLLVGPRPRRERLLKNVGDRGASEDKSGAAYDHCLVMWVVGTAIIAGREEVSTSSPRSEMQYKPQACSDAVGGCLHLPRSEKTFVLAA